MRNGRRECVRLLLAIALSVAAGTNLQAKHILPGPHYFHCEARGNDVVLSWDHLGISPDDHDALLFRDEKLLAALEPDAVLYRDGAVPAGKHAYRLDITDRKGGAVIVTFSCEAEVLLTAGIRCEVFGGIAIPPRLLISWDPLPPGLRAEKIDVFRDGDLMASLPGDAAGHEEEPLQGEHEYRLTAALGPEDPAGDGREIVLGDCLVTFEPPRIGGFVRGDCNGDGEEDLSDAICVLLHLFQGAARPPCLSSADADDSGVLDLTDAIYLTGFLFLGHRAPPAPFPDCGDDATPDDLGCEAFPPCFHPPPP